MSIDFFEEWVIVPKIGTLVKARHPVTILNPTKVFEVQEIKIEGLGIYAKGTQTCWFHVNILSEPTSEEKAEYLGISAY